MSTWERLKGTFQGGETTQENLVLREQKVFSFVRGTVGSNGEGKDGSLSYYDNRNHLLT